MNTQIGEDCGIIGVYGIEDAARIAYMGLYTLQHRGQESAGVVVSDGRKIRSVKDFGLVSEALDPEEMVNLKGEIGIGHVRYSTTGTKRVQNIQPLIVEYDKEIVAIGHNGNLVNTQSLRSRYEEKGSIFQTSTDSEIFVHLLADPKFRSCKDPLAESLSCVKGAYSVVMMNADTLTAFRDPGGFHPLSIGRLGNGYIVSSETCVFDVIGAEFVRDVAPGEIVRMNKNGLRSTTFADKNCSYCIFEHIYFARPDSMIFGDNVHEVRKQLGIQLARNDSVDADVVIAVPDSGNSAAYGYSLESGIPLERGFIRNYYIGRTFIMPDTRLGNVELKLNIIKDVVHGKRVVVVDDSIVRGTTSKSRMKRLRDFGAREIHLRISAPPIRFPCHFGIDFQHADELIARDYSEEKICEFVGADTLKYQTVDGLLASVSGNKSDYCLGCFTGDKPMETEENLEKKMLESH